MTGCSGWYRFVVSLLPLTVAGAFVGNFLAAPAMGQDLDADLERAVTESLHGPDGVGKDGPLAKMGTDLIRLYHAYEEHRPRTAKASFTPAHSYLQVVDDERVVIDAVAQEDPETLRTQLEELGLQHGTVAGRLVSGQVPIGALDAVAELDALHRARAALATTHVGSTTSQGDVALYTDTLRNATVLNGDGVMVGVLSDSYNNHEANPATMAWNDIRSGDLPGAENPEGHGTSVTVLNDAITGTDEGRALLQIIHDLAPKAGLAFHSAFGGMATFIEGIHALADVGCQVLVDDVFYFAEPMFQDGLIGQAIEEVVAEDDVVYVMSAGNSGENGYAASFRPSGRDLSSIVDDGAGVLHDFDPQAGTDPRQEIIVGAGETAVVSLQWDDPFYTVSGDPGANTDLDAYLLDGSEVVARSTDANVGGDPVEILIYQNPSASSVRLDFSVARTQGPAPERLKYIMYGGAQPVEYITRSPTISGHSDIEGAISVGASAWYNTPRVPSYNLGSDPPVLNGFSAKGGTPLLYSDDGTRLNPPRVRQKPDLTATDGVNTTFLGFDILHDPDPDPNFFGTSAAAPHVAAVAALMREARSSMSPQAIRDRLRASAVDIQHRVDGGELMTIPDGEGSDFYSGAGLMRADQATLSLLPARVASLSAQVEEGGGRARLDWMTVWEARSHQFIVEYHPGHRREDPSTSTWRRAGTVQSKAGDGESRDTLQYDLATTVPSPGRYVFRLQHEQDDGKIQRVGPRTEVKVPFEGNFELGGPRPHPVGSQSKMHLVVRRGQNVRLDLYDTIGRRVRTLHDEYLAPERPLVFQLDATDLASGVYFLRVDADHFTTTRRVVRVR